jgi:RNA polymerase sigma-70 factor (ECF subfamily)
MKDVDRTEELALVARLRAGDADAFDRVYEGLNARLFNFLARLSRRPDVAEDLLEETWLRFVHHAPRLRPDTTLAAFLFTIARNLHVSYCRSRQLEDSYSTTLLGLWPSGSPSPSPFESTAANETERRIESLVAQMPAAYREALLLVCVEGMAANEAAVVCNISAEAMRQRVSRARAMLARGLEGQETPIPLKLKEATA